ncbi:hypothetical protein SDJN03_27442, partial [Cucurbita argyrosperma subsp. sororia]
MSSAAIGDGTWTRTLRLGRPVEYSESEIRSSSRTLWHTVTWWSWKGRRNTERAIAERCKKGLKLQVHVEAQQQKAETTGVGSRDDMSEGDGESAAVPPSPSTSSTPFAISYVTLSLLLAGLAFTYWIS